MFSNLVGNNTVKGVLKRLLETKRVPNALLFSGPSGVGKRQFALELAAAMVCKARKNAEACGSCSSCVRSRTFVFPRSDSKDDHKKVIFSSHADVGTVISFNRYILVDAIRDLEVEANFRPYEADARVFIIDDADRMNEASSNALLKTLEEPPPTSHVFLITSRADTLLQTIRSRCQVIRFSPVSAPEIEEFLTAERGVGPDEAAVTARLSAGSLAEASAFDLDEFRELRDPMMESLKCAVDSGEVSRLLQISEQMNDARNSQVFERRLDILEGLARDLLRLKVSGDAGAIVNADIAGDLFPMAANVDVARLSRILGEIELLRQSLAVNINRRVATDALFVSMAS